MLFYICSSQKILLSFWCSFFAWHLGLRLTYASAYHQGSHMF
uniref:Uncharacterized protein n=1 Tax=Arundo donax TaxID=35708 RepID=A0A0A9T4B0_ARUDO